MKYVIIWFVLAATVAIGLVSLNWPAYRRMVVRGVSGQATVVDLLPKNHQTVRYEYHVAGRIFQGCMQSWQPNAPLEQLRVGQTLVIYYDPEHPEESVLGDPRPMLKNETISIALGALIFPTFFVLAWARRGRRVTVQKRA
jgi:uncharacterized protein DUF3592